MKIIRGTRTLHYTVCAHLQAP